MLDDDGVCFIFRIQYERTFSCLKKKILSTPRERCCVCTETCVFPVRKVFKFNRKGNQHRNDRKTGKNRSYAFEFRDHEIEKECFEIHSIFLLFDIGSKRLNGIAFNLDGDTAAAFASIVRKGGGRERELSKEESKKIRIIKRPKKRKEHSDTQVL